MKNRRALPAALALTLCLAFGGCDRGSDPDAKGGAEPGKGPGASARLDGVFLPAPLAAAKSLLEVKASAKAGDTVVFEGAVGGRKAPFVEDRAVFLVADNALEPCSEGCRTPWDVCCETAETIAAHSASVQVVDEAGSPLKLGLDGQGGLAPGAKVQVKGKVRQNENGVCVVDASAIHVVAK